MCSLKNDLLLRALRREPVEMTPIWIMRQAGRYLPEYRRTRARAGSFMTLCKTPELACEVTLQPLARYQLDAAILFSDILTIPDAMGLGVEFVEGKGPFFKNPIRDAHAINQLKVPQREHLDYVYQAIRLVKVDLAGSLPLIGFCGSPWTLAAYMVQGKSTPGFPLLMDMLQKEPILLHQLLDILAYAVADHLYAQIQAGVQAVMIFDTWGGLLNGAAYEEFSLKYIRQLIMLMRANHYNNSESILKK